MVAKYASNPRKENETWYSSNKPDSSKRFYDYADVEFSGEWNRDFAETDPTTTKSRSDCFILNDNCPVIWCYKLQSQVALSTTVAEYIALSQAPSNIIPVMSLLSKMREHKFTVILVQLQIYCEDFQDNSGALELARLPKLQIYVIITSENM
ncbi:hypothetical protein ACHAW6_010190 [Cyclotella cf. meneghiniana]